MHRVGRTARAGAPGTAHTLLRRQEVLHFKKLRQAIDGKAVATVALKSEDYAQVRHVPTNYPFLVHFKVCIYCETG